MDPAAIPPGLIFSPCQLSEISKFPPTMGAPAFAAIFSGAERNGGKVIAREFGEEAENVEERSLPSIAFVRRS